MKTIKKTIYTLTELKAQFPDGYKRAFAAHKSCVISDGYIPCQDEIMGSLKAVFAAAGVEMGGRWSVGPYSRSTYIRADFPRKNPNSDPWEVQEFIGKRAMAWLENNLFSQLRTPWRDPKRWIVRRYGSCYQAGFVPPCPLTGYFADDVFLESLRDSVRTGSTLGEAFSTLAVKAAKMMEAECEYQQSEENFLEGDDGEEKWDEDGEEIG